MLPMKKIAFTLSITTGIVLMHVDSSAQEWKELGTGANALNANGSIHALATDKQGSIYAGGAFRSYVGNPNDIFYVAKWNGTTWSQLGTGTAALNANSTINTIATDTSGNVYAAGEFYNVGADHLNRYVAKWDGNSWQELGSGSNVLAANDNIQSVATDHAGNVYAAGNFKDESYTYYYVAKWNGNTWSELGNLNANSTIYALATDALGNVYAAGSFTDNNGKIYVAKWNGSSWQALGDPISSNLGAGYSFIRKIAFDDQGNIYVTGNITDANNKYYVAKLNGNTWAPLGSGSAALNANGAILGLSVRASNNVNVAGGFTNSSGQPYVAQWNGNTWSEVGTGTAALNPNGTIFTVLLDQALNVYAGGGFYNQQGLFYVAKYGDSVINENPTGMHHVSHKNNPVIIPNPAKSVLLVQHLAADYTQLDILNISGAKILTRKISHDKEIININSLNPGIYLLQLTGEKGKAVFKWIKE